MSSRAWPRPIVATSQRAAAYPSPYAAVEAFASHDLSEDELVETLGTWDYAKIPDRRDPVGVISDARPATANSAEEITKALAHRLIDRRVFARIRESIHEHQGDLQRLHSAVVGTTPGEK